MNWEVISNERSSLMEYRLIDHNNCVEVIKYNPLHRSARLTTGNHHRLFFLESAGSLSGKTIFKNEYGMEIGNLVHDKFHPKEGSVLIDTKRYHYQIQTTSVTELIIFENDPAQPIASCGLPEGTTAIQSQLSANTQVIDNNCFLLGLCWYLFLPLVNSNSLEYASAIL